MARKDRGGTADPTRERELPFQVELVSGRGGNVEGRPAQPLGLGVGEGDRGLGGGRGGLSGGPARGPEGVATPGGHGGTHFGAQEPPGSTASRGAGEGGGAAATPKERKPGDRE